MFTWLTGLYVSFLKTAASVVQAIQGQATIFLDEADNTLKARKEDGSLVNLECCSQPIEETVTLAQLNVLINNNSLIPGAFYLITGVDAPLYGGTDIILQAVANNALSADGQGRFYNAPYDQSTPGFGIFDNTAVYAPTDRVIWGGMLWENVTGNTGAAVDIFTLDAEWQVVPYNTTDYIVVWDSIEYDINNDFIVSRKEVIGNNYVSCSFLAGNVLQADYSFLTNNPIKVFQWGNVINTGIGIGSNYCYDSYVECINYTGINFILNNFTELSVFYNNVCDTTSTIFEVLANNRAEIYNLSLVSDSEVYQISLKNGSKLYDLTLDNTTTEQINLSNDSSIYNIVATNSQLEQLICTNDASIHDINLINSSVLQQVECTNNSSLLNLSIDNADFIDHKINGNVNLDYLTLTITTNISNIVATGQNLTFTFSKTFDGTAGNGAVGALTLPPFVVPQDYIVVEPVFREVVAVTANPNAELNLGFDVDDPTAIIGGDVVALLPNSINILPPAANPGITTTTRAIVGSVAVADITGGQLLIQVQCSKI